MVRSYPFLLALSLAMAGCAFDVGSPPSEQITIIDIDVSPVDADAGATSGDLDGEERGPDVAPDATDDVDIAADHDAASPTLTPSLTQPGLSASSFSGTLQGGGFRLAPLGTGARFSGTARADDGRFNLKALP